MTTSTTTTATARARRIRGLFQEVRAELGRWDDSSEVRVRWLRERLEEAAREAKDPALARALRAEAAELAVSTH